MKNTITKVDTLKNIFQRKLYLFMLLGGLIIVFSIPFLAQSFVVPSFYKQMIQNTLEDAKKVGTHIARHQNVDDTSSVLYTAIDKLREDFKIVKIRLFDAKGTIVFSTQTEEIGTNNAKDYYFEVVAKGKIFYKVVQKGTKSFDGNDIARDVAEIYVPYMKDGVFKGSSEIYYDITDKKLKFLALMEKINLFYYLFSLFLFTIIFYVIFILSRNNLLESNIEKELSNKVEQKTQELIEINKNLEERIKQEVEKNRAKDTHLFQQSKLASMGEMIGNIAHQWRQPLSAITSTASSVSLNSQLGILESSEIEEKMNGIVTKANFLSETINNFRDFFKTDQKTQSFNLINTIYKVESIIDSNYKNESISIIYEFYGQEQISVTSLEGELSQVIINILNNSYDNFVEKKSTVKLVKITAQKIGNSISMQIIDTGGGIPENIIQKVFEPYFTTKHQSQGTGIGLYMCAQIIKNHLHGDIKVYNDNLELNGNMYTGACFEITFPQNSQ